MTIFKSIAVVAFLAVILAPPFITESSAQTTSCQSRLRGLSHSKLDYLLDKVIELRNFDQSHYYAGSLRAAIMITRKRVEVIAIPVSDLRPIHPITYDITLEKTAKRAQVVQQYLPEIFKAQNTISLDLANRILPSKNSIRVIPYSGGGYVVYDGNGRVEAIRKAVGERTDIRIEVEVSVTDSEVVQELLRKVLQLRGLIDNSGNSTIP